MKKEMIVKHNAIIGAAHAMSLVEQRMLLICMSKINRMGGELHDRHFKVTIHEYQEATGAANGYSDLVAASHRLMDRKLEILQDVEIGGQIYNSCKIQMVTFVAWQKNGGCVHLAFSDEFMPYLKDFSKHYTKYYRDDVMRMTSRFSPVLYEILKRTWDKHKKHSAEPYFFVESKELRKIFCLGDKYKKPRDFRRFVVQRAVDEINEHTSLVVSYSQKKEGRSILGFTFRVKSATSLKKENTTKAQKKLENFVKQVLGAFREGRRVVVKGKVVESVMGEFTMISDGNSYNLYSELKKNPSLKDEISIT